MTVSLTEKAILYFCSVLFHKFCICKLVTVGSCFWFGVCGAVFIFIFILFQDRYENLQICRYMDQDGMCMS